MSQIHLIKAIREFSQGKKAGLVKKGAIMVRHAALAGEAPTHLEEFMECVRQVTRLKSTR